MLGSWSLDLISLKILKGNIRFWASVPVKKSEKLTSYLAHLKQSFLPLQSTFFSCEFLFHCVKRLFLLHLLPIYVPVDVDSLDLFGFEKSSGINISIHREAQQFFVALTMT